MSHKPSPASGKFESSNLLRQFRALNKRQHQASFATRNTYRQSTQAILRYCHDVFHIQKMENIRDRHIRSYLAAQEDKSLCTIKKELSGFRYYEDMLVRDGKNCHFSASNHALGVDKPIDFHGKTAASPGEITRMHNYASHLPNPDLRYTFDTAVTLCSEFGLRSKEVFCLRVSQIRTASRWIDSGKPVYLSLTGEGCKGGRARQIGPLNHQQTEVIRQMATLIPAEKYTDDYLLRDRTIDHSLQKRLNWWHNTFSLHGADFADEARVNRPEWDRTVSAHDLRRTFADNLYHTLREQDMPPREAFNQVANNLGHGRNRFSLARCYLDAEAVAEIEG